MKIPKAPANTKARIKKTGNDELTKKIAFERMAMYCVAMAERGNETQSLMISGLSRKQMLSYCEQWPELEDKRREAVREVVDKLRDAAWTRAVDGVVQPVFQRGQNLGMQTQYSDQLLKLLLQSEDPNKFADRRQISGPDGGPIEFNLKVDIDAARRRFIEKIINKS